MSPVISQFCALYSQFGPESLVGLSDVYSDEVVFEDPAHRLVGLTSMTAYFEGMLANTKQCSFIIEHVVEQQGNAFVSWTMTFSHPKLKSGQLISVPGVSHLKFTELVDFHRDYFDMGEMIYEQLPLLGTVIRQIKARLAV